MDLRNKSVWGFTLASTVVCLTMVSSRCWWLLVSLGPWLFFSSCFCITVRAYYKYIKLLTHLCCTHPQWDVSPLQGFSAGSAARLFSSSPAPSLCWWSVWPDMSAGGGEGGWDTSPPPQHACKHMHLSKSDCVFSVYWIRPGDMLRRGRCKSNKFESNHRLQRGPQPSNCRVHTEISASLNTTSFKKLRRMGDKTHQLKAYSLGAIVHVFQNRSWICHSLIP